MCNTLGYVCSLIRAQLSGGVTQQHLTPILLIEVLGCLHWKDEGEGNVLFWPFLVGALVLVLILAFVWWPWIKHRASIFPRWSKQDLNVVTCTWYCSKSWSSMIWLCSSNEISLLVRAVRGTAHSFVLAALSCRFCWLHCPAFHRAPSSLDEWSWKGRADFSPLLHRQSFNLCHLEGDCAKRKKNAKKAKWFPGVGIDALRCHQTTTPWGY